MLLVFPDQERLAPRLSSVLLIRVCLFPSQFTNPSCCDRFVNSNLISLQIADPVDSIDLAAIALLLK